jgi:hypothetical protein
MLTPVRPATKLIQVAEEYEELARLFEVGRSVDRPYKGTGARLGNPVNLNEAGAAGRAVQAHAADEFTAGLLPMLKAIQRAGATTLAEIADALNERGAASGEIQVLDTGGLADVRCDLREYASPPPEKQPRNSGWGYPCPQEMKAPD